jgi:precorrin-6Y C5,15-methyltransferase (decarboxylating)
MSAPATDPVWLTLIGLGEDGLAGLSPAASRALEQASFIVGGARHLALLGATTAQCMAWPTPLEAGVEAVLARRGRPTCVLASGDPFHYGVGATLARHLPANEMRCLPAPSAFSLICARLGWAQQDCALLSLHGRPLERLAPHLQPGARILALTWDGETPRKVAERLVALGMGRSRLIVCEAMGGPRERRVESTAAEFHGVVDALNTLAIEVVADRGARIMPLASGLADDLFEHDSQITKREVRAITLSTLAPRRGELLWDIGAGSGSISIEWMLRHPANRAIAIETRADRAARIGRNALELGVPDLRIVEGAAPAALAGLPTPDAIFIGGGGTDAGVLDAAFAALPEGGRLVVNAVTLETQSEIMRRHVALGGALTKIEIARADPVGPFHGWRAAMPVMQWSIVKGEAP